MHAMLSNDYKRKVSCMAAGAPAAFCRTSRRGFASPQSARSSFKSFHLISALETWNATLRHICLHYSVLCLRVVTRFRLLMNIR